MAAQVEAKRFFRNKINREKGYSCGSRQVFKVHKQFILLTLTMAEFADSALAGPRQIHSGSLSKWINSQVDSNTCYLLEPSFTTVSQLAHLA